MNSSLFDTDKPELLERVLERHEVAYNPNKGNWQLVRCPNGDAHAHGDRTPSLSINLGTGKVACHACDLSGDGFDIMLLLEDLKAQQALDALELEGGKEISEWLI